MNVYEIITDKFVKAIESGENPFYVKPWTMGIVPRNFASGRRYHGINVLLLAVEDGEKGLPMLYCTFRQAKKIGGKIRKGSKSRIVAYWNIFFVDADGEIVEGATEADGYNKRFSLRYYRVFNITDVENIDREKYIKKYADPANEFEGADRNADADRFIEATGAKISYGGMRAYYSPMGDRIQLPNREDFRSTGHFYSVAFHELTHWTGHEDRLNRELAGKMARVSYSKEELTAEIGASFLCSDFGFDSKDLWDNSVAYLKGWLKPLKDDPKMIVWASSKAEKAVNYLHECSEAMVETEAA